MPTSKRAEVSASSVLDFPEDYPAALGAFIAKTRAADPRHPVVALFHAVRNIPYFSSGERSPYAVLRDNRGACTAKHILLRDALRRVGEVADVELIEGDFAASMAQHKSMPDDLKSWITTGGIRDYHCYVVWRSPVREVCLDATWPDMLRPYGFTVNSEWTGDGDTALAIVPTFVKVRVEDVIARKERLIHTLTREDAHNRKLFLGLLSDWLASLPTV